MTSDFKMNLNLPIYEQAADWLIELREDEIDAATRERLDAWFRASPEHIRAYLELSAIWEDGADADLDRAHSTDELIARARDRSNVISLNAGAEQAVNANDSVTPAIASPSDAGTLEATSADERPEKTMQRTDMLGEPRDRTAGAFLRSRPVWAAVVLLAFVIGSGGLYLYGQRNLSFETATGEQRFVKLVDGSTMELNSRSRVRIRFTDGERDVDLIEGQALFHVAKDSARPFIVHSGSTLVRAVGTQFDVYRKASGTTVTVVEGRVAVLSPMLEAEPKHSQSGDAVAPQASLSGRFVRTPLPGDDEQAAATAAQIQNSAKTALPDPVLSDAPNAIYLVAGEQVTVSSQAIPRPTHADPTAATAWTQHELVFESTSLNEVAQEFNRYNTRQLTISDPALRDFHISGIFSSADPASLIKFLRAQHDIVVEETDDDIRVSKR